MTNVILLLLYPWENCEQKKKCQKALNQAQHIVPINKQQQK